MAQHDPQRMGSADLLVAVGTDEQYPGRTEPSGEEGQEVQRRLVGPVQVVDDQDPAQGIDAPQSLQDGREERPSPGGLALEQYLDPGRQLRRDVDEGAEW